MKQKSNSCKSSLSPRGEEFGAKLGDFMKQQPEDTIVWTSELQRTRQTAT